jgi:hypothetical protein
MYIHYQGPGWLCQPDFASWPMIKPIGFRCRRPGRRFPGV